MGLIVGGISADYILCPSPTQQNDRGFVALGRFWDAGGGFPICCASRKKAGIPAFFVYQVKKKSPTEFGGETPVDNFRIVNWGKIRYQ